MAYHKGNINPATGKRRGSREDIVRSLFIEGNSRETIFLVTVDNVWKQREPFVYGENTGQGGRTYNVPLDIQIAKHFQAIRNIVAKMIAEGFATEFESYGVLANYEEKSWRRRLLQSETTRHNQGTVNEPVTASEPPPVAPIAEPIVAEPVSVLPEPVSEPTGIRAKIAYLERRLYELRDFVVARKSTEGKDFDFISTRAFVEGMKAIRAGIEVDDFLVSIGLAWSEDIRRAAGIKSSVDFERYAIPGTSKVTGFVTRLVYAGIPVYLVGPTGSGKSVLARSVSEILRLGYTEIPLSSGVSRSDFLGSHTAGGFVPRPAVGLYENGGCILLEEIDACDPNVLLLLNNAIANQSLFSSVEGREVVKNELTRFMASANTMANGATANYSAREGLDGSTIDRFKYGRVLVDYDRDIESSILWSEIDSLTEAEDNGTLYPATLTLG